MLVQVCVKVGSEEELLHLAGDRGAGAGAGVVDCDCDGAGDCDGPTPGLAKAAGLVTGVVRDAGRTQVGWCWHLIPGTGTFHLSSVSFHLVPPGGGWLLHSAGDRTRSSGTGTKGSIENMKKKVSVNSENRL